MADLHPPGMSAAAFEQALDGFRGAVGAQWVFASEADRASYLDPFSIGDPQEHASAAAVAPGSVDELRAVLDVANRFGLPLWPVSMGKNFAYGTAAPRLKNSVVLDLKRMNRVLEVNERLGYAVVEPGVSFFDFKEELDRRGSKLWMSGPSHSWGSVIGNALEHGVGYTPYGNHAEAICGMEVMLADGSLVRTGMGAVANTREWQCYKWPFGPQWDGLFTQSNFGIVTKMGIWLMPEPAGMAGVTISVPRREQFADLIDALQRLRLDDTINAPYTIANAWRQLTSGRRRSDIYTGEGAIPRATVETVLGSAGSGWWSVIFNLFDRPAALDIRLAAIEQEFRSTVPGVSIAVRRWARGEPQQAWMRQDVGLAPMAIVDWPGGRGGHTDLGPVVAAVGERAEEVYALLERRFLEFGIDPWIGMFGVGNRALIIVADLIYNRDDADMVARCRSLFRTVCEDLAGIGVGLYRSHVTFMDDAVKMHTWGDHALPRLNDRLKGLLDPNNILAPGKQGIGSRVP
jgi:4-cresol dehydrogenase (hydroxylating) flavoprotein subunit